MMLPYACPCYPNTFFMRQDCSKRKVLAANRNWSQGFPGLEVRCLHCLGPVPRDELIVASPIAPAKKNLDKLNERMPSGRKRKPHKCKICGETQADHFYDKDKTVCRVHRLAAMRKRRNTGPRTVKVKCPDCNRKREVTKYYAADHRSEGRRCQSCSRRAVVEAKNSLDMTK